MFFEFSFSTKHLKELKKNPDALYKLVGKLVTFSALSFAELVTTGKENGLSKVSGTKIHKKLNIDTQLDVYKFRLSNKYRCYCTKHLILVNVMNLHFLDIHHQI